MGNPTTFCTYLGIFANGGEQKVDLVLPERVSGHLEYDDARKCFFVLFGFFLNEKKTCFFPQQKNVFFSNPTLPPMGRGLCGRDVAGVEHFVAVVVAYFVVVGFDVVAARSAAVC